MKIVFSSYHNPHFLTITEYIEKAFLKEEHDLVTFDDRQFFIPGRIREKCSILEYWDLRRLNLKLLKLVNKTQPNICVVTGGHRVLASTIQKLKSRNIKTCLWTIDPPQEFGPLIKVAPFYDYVFCGGTEAIEILNNNGIRTCHWLPFAFSSQDLYPVSVNDAEWKKYGFDVVFVGSYYPNREKILEKLTDFKLRVFGPSWNLIQEESPLRKCVVSEHIKPDEWNKIYQASKIVVVIHYQDGKTPCYQASPKVYETLACKGFVLCDDQRDVKNLFVDGKHLVIFKSVDDLRDKIQYYLHHPSERAKIAEAGYQEVMAKHTYVHRIRELLSVVGK